MIDVNEYLEQTKQDCCELLNINHDDVLLTVGESLNGTLGTYSPSHFYQNKKDIGLIAINPILFQKEYQLLLFFVILHELVHHKLKEFEWLIDELYDPHGILFKKEFENIGVIVDDIGYLIKYSENSDFHKRYLDFLNLSMPITINTEEKIINEKNVSIIGHAKCPKCKLSVTTNRNHELICKKCSVELINDYNKLLLAEYKERKELLSKSVKHFEYLCFYHPIKKIQKNQNIKEALNEVTNLTVFDAIYDGDITEKGKKDLFIGANNVIVARKNVNKIEEILNGK